MDAKTTAELKGLLEAERDRLALELADLERDSATNLSDQSGENNYRDHMADQGTATFERELDIVFEENERDTLDAVRAAIARVDAGTYGTCLRCGADIPAARLSAVPTATLCITCKEAEESPR